MELTDKQKAEAKEVLNKMMDYFWHRVLVKVNVGMSFEVAITELLEEILNDH